MAQKKSTIAVAKIYVSFVICIPNIELPLDFFVRKMDKVQNIVLGCLHQMELFSLHSENNLTRFIQQII